MEGSSEDELSEEEHDDKAMINSSTEQSPHIEALPLQVICRHKLSDEEIKSLPRFANHKPGQPSNVLYLKNLHPKVTEDDLHAIFGHHQSQASEKLKIRLLTGRMKGQAFVEFPSKNMLAVYSFTLAQQVLNWQHLQWSWSMVI